MDLNSDGFIDVEEYVTVDKIMDEKTGRTFNEEMTRREFEKMDTDKDGKLSLEEWKAYQKEQSKRMPPAETVRNINKMMDMIAEDVAALKVG